MGNASTPAIRATLVVLAGLITLAPTGPVEEGRWGVGERPHARIPQGVGTVQYDPGAPADIFLTGGPGTAPSYLNGNRFDTRNGSPLSPGTVTGVSWYQGADPAGFAGVVIAPIGGPPLFAIAYDPMPYAFNSAAPVPVASPFFAGLALNPALSFGSIGARSATYNGGGFHGHQQSFSGGTTNPLTNLNVMIRATGSMIIPVELLEFAVE